jgi:hypothetical protein
MIQDFLPEIFRVREQFSQEGFHQLEKDIGMYGGGSREQGKEA